MSLLPISLFEFQPSAYGDFYDALDCLFPTFNRSSYLTTLPYSKPASDIYRIKLEIGHYKPEEIAVSIEDDKLIVKGSHRHDYGNGHDTSDFVRTFEIPSEVMKETITHRIASNGGLLIIEGKKKQPEKRHFFQDLSTKDQFNVTFDVKGYKPEEVKVALNGRELVVQGSHEQSTNDENKFSEQRKSFYKMITLQPDVLVDTVQPKMTKDNYLHISAKKDANLLNSNTRHLEITHE